CTSKLHVELPSFVAFSSEGNTSATVDSKAGQSRGSTSLPKLVLQTSAAGGGQIEDVIVCQRLQIEGRQIGAQRLHFAVVKVREAANILSGETRNGLCVAERFEIRRRAARRDAADEPGGNTLAATEIQVIRIVGNEEKSQSCRGGSLQQTFEHRPRGRLAR